MVWMIEKACLILNEKGFCTQYTKEIQHRNLLQYFMQLLYKNVDNKFKLNLKASFLLIRK